MAPKSYYLSSQIAFCLFVYVAILYFSYFMWTEYSEGFGKAIYYETHEWDKGAIMDVTAVDSLPCPSGYENVTGTFYGTHTICKKPNFNGLDESTYTMGKCGKQPGTSITGMP